MADVACHSQCLESQFDFGQLKNQNQYIKCLFSVMGKIGVADNINIVIIYLILNLW